MLSVGQHFSLSSGQFYVIASLLAVFTCRDIALVFCDGGLARFRWRKCGVVAFAPSALTIFRIALIFCGGHFSCFRRCHLGMIACSGSHLTVGEVEFVL